MIDLIVVVLHFRGAVHILEFLVGHCPQFGVESLLLVGTLAKIDQSIKSVLEAPKGPGIGGLDAENEAVVLLGDDQVIVAPYGEENVCHPGWDVGVLGLQQKVLLIAEESFLVVKELEILSC